MQTFNVLGILRSSTVIFFNISSFLMIMTFGEIEVCVQCIAGVVRSQWAVFLAHVGGRWHLVCSLVDEVSPK